MTSLRRGAAAAALLVVCAALGTAAGPIRGVDPDVASQYEPVNGKFRCLDDGKAIPFSQVNDGYCDCLDGTDEPGTAACPDGKFYCKNTWFQPQQLNASFVDDGVCDCCDGTDEPEGTCANTCKAKGSEALAGLREELADARAGLAERRKYTKAAAAARAQWAARLKEIAGAEGPAKQRQQRTAARRDQLEKQETKLQATKTRLEALVAPPPAPAAEATPADAGVEAEAEAADEAAAGDNGDSQEAGAGDDGPSDEDDASVVDEEEESSEDRAKRVASQWIPGAGGGADEGGGEEAPPPLEDDSGPSAEEADEEASIADDEALMEGAEEEEGEDEDASEDDAAAEGGDAQLGLFARAAGWAAGAWARVRGRGGPAAALTRAEVELAAVRRSLVAARADASAAAAAADGLAAEKRDLAAKQGHDYGPDAAFAPLADRCVDAVVDKYTYRVCPYGRAEQLDGASPTSLGSWSGFEAGFSRLKFTGGAHCWQGPERSMTVEVRCGRGEALSRVSEPSRCEYAAEMTTPAACTEGRVAELAAELEAREGLLRAAKDEL